jgi:hypothetical protein
MAVPRPQRPTPAARPAPAPAARPPLQATLGSNFTLGTDMPRLQQQAQRAQSEIQRRGGTAPNNQLRLDTINQQMQRLQGGGGSQPPPGGRQPQMGPPLTTAPEPRAGIQPFPSSGGSMPGNSQPEDGGPINTLPVSGMPGFGGQGPGAPATGSPGYNGGDSSITVNNPYSDISSGMFSQGANYNPYQYQGSNAGKMLDSVYDQSTNGSIQSFNTAANRLRERTDAATAGASDAARNKNLGRGFGNSGLNDADQFRTQATGADAYAGGLANLETGFEQTRQQGLQTALGAANSTRQGMENYNQLQQGDLAQRRDLNQNNRQFMDRSMLDLLNNRENRGSAYDLARGGWKNSTDLEAIRGNNELQRQKNQNGWQSGESSLDRQTQERLAQLTQNGANWREILGSIPGLYNAVNGNGTGSTGGGGIQLPNMPSLGSGGSIGGQAPSVGGGSSSGGARNGGVVPMPNSYTLGYN